MDKATLYDVAYDVAIEIQNANSFVDITADNTELTGLILTVLEENREKLKKVLDADEN